MQLLQSDLLQLLAQYLEESKLLKTLEALGKETNLKFNHVSSKVEIRELIMGGSVTDLLDKMKNWDLSDNCTQQLYILIFYQLLADGETDLANNLLINSQPLSILRDTNPVKFLTFSEMESVDSGILQEQREIVVGLLMEELEQVYDFTLYNRYQKKDF